MRKIVQIAFDTTGDADSINSGTYVLCDDESVWYLSFEYGSPRWVRCGWPPIPQEPTEEREG